MERTLPIAQEAAIGFVRAMAEEDVATVVDFDSRVQILQGFTNATAALEDAIRRTSANGSTSLYNAVYIALRELGKVMPYDAREAPRRRVMIVLSDGEDTSSLVNFDQVLDTASRSDAVVYTIGLGVTGIPTRRGSEAGDFVLRRLAQQTGGRPFFISAVGELRDVYG
jgi:Ca-activated chloride channel family protein